MSDLGATSTEHDGDENSVDNEAMRAAIEAYRGLFSPDEIAAAAMRKRTLVKVVDDAFVEQHQRSSADRLIQQFHSWGDRKERTRDDYANSVREFATWLDGTPLPEVQRRDVILYMDYLEHHRPRPLSPSRRKNQLAGLRSFYSWLMYIDEDRKYDPTQGVIRPKVVVRRQPVLTPEELALVLQAPGTARDRVQVWLMTFTAARVAEIRSLKWSDVDGENQLIHLWGKGDKPRSIDIHPSLMPELVKWRLTQQKQAAENPLLAQALSHPDTSFVLLTDTGKQIAENALWKALKCRAARVGVMPLEVEKDKRGRVGNNKSAITPHMLRRTFATTLLRSGTDLDTVADILGHASLDTTRKHYAFTSDERTRNAINSFKI